MPQAGAGSEVPQAGAGSAVPQAGAGSEVPHAVPQAGAALGSVVPQAAKAATLERFSDMVIPFDVTHRWKRRDETRFRAWLSSEKVNSRKRRH